MEYKEFLKHIKSLTHPIILLEGKRKVTESDKPFLVVFGKKLSEDLPTCKFRSGNAKGADELFCKGVKEFNPNRLELVLPYKNHRAEGAKNCMAYSLEDISLVKEPEIVYETRNEKNKNLIEQYLTGGKNWLTAKAPYLLRDTVKVIGSKGVNLRKADFAIFYDDLNEPQKGRTGHTMMVCKNNSVPYIDQSVWMKWLGEN